MISSYQINDDPAPISPEEWRRQHAQKLIDLERLHATNDNHEVERVAQRAAIKQWYKERRAKRKKSRTKHH